MIDEEIVILEPSADQWDQPLTVAETLTVWLAVSLVCWLAVAGLAFSVLQFFRWLHT